MEVFSAGGQKYATVDHDDNDANDDDNDANDDKEDTNDDDEDEDDDDAIDAISGVA